jgi:4-hydroxybenzoate polyprenyltransferase
MSTITQRWMGQGNTIKGIYSTGEKMAGWVDITRPILTIMGALGVASAAALANRGFPSWDLALTGFLAALFAFAGIHTFNDYIDTRRDASCWPGRPIPGHRLTSRQALLLAIVAFIVSLAIIWVFFNPLCFIISVISVVLGCLYSAWLRDNVGYLVLPPIQSLLWLCGWTAFSPSTLFASWIPWVLYLFSIAWQSGHIMIYSPLHPIRKVKESKLTQVPAFFVKTTPRAAAIWGFIFLWLAVGMGIFMGFYTGLGLIVVIPVCIMGVFSLVSSYQFMRQAENFSKGIKSFQSATYFMLVTRVFILTGVFFFIR